jgi:ABC-type glycerol-3-phosphate transport system permease component
MERLDRVWNIFRSESLWVQIIVALLLVGIIGTLFVTFTDGDIYLPDGADSGVTETLGDNVDRGDYGSSEVEYRRIYAQSTTPTGEYQSANGAYCVILEIAAPQDIMHTGHFIAVSAGGSWAAYSIASQSAWQEAGCSNWEANVPSPAIVFVLIAIIAMIGIGLEIRRKNAASTLAPGEVLTPAVNPNASITNWKGKTVLYIILSVASVVALLPFFWMISSSLMTLGETLNKRWLPGSIDISGCPIWKVELPIPTNYCEALDVANFEKFFMNSVIISAVSIIGVLVISVLAGYAFARIKFVGRDFIFTLLLATLMIPASVTLIPNFITIRGDTIPLPDLALTGEAGLQASWQAGNSWLNTLYALTVPFMGSPFIIFLLRQFFAQIPDELWDAARIDGAGHLRFLVQICLPISKPAIWTATLLTFIQSWNSFLWPLIVTTEDVWRPIMVGLWNFVTDAGPQTHLLMAGAVITMLPMLIIYFIAQKSFTEGIATSGLKG